MPENLAQNQINTPSCYTCVAKCPYCEHGAKKYGFTLGGKQRFRCKECCKTFIAVYTKKLPAERTDNKIKALLKEGCGIRSIGRILKISAVSVVRKIRTIASCIKMPEIQSGQSFETDELYTFVGSKNSPIWVIYAINTMNKDVVSFNVGRRTNKDISLVINSLINSHPQRIYTDKLVNYRSLIPNKIHSTKCRGTNHIERKNLTLRTHLKRLNRRTICFSKSETMLYACLGSVTLCCYC